MFTTFFTNPNYLYRENALFGFKAISQYVSNATKQKLVSQITQLAKNEQVPSVLVLILQTVKEFQESVDDPAVNAMARDLCKSLQDYPDADVSYYAQLNAPK